MPLVCVETGLARFRSVFEKANLPKGGDAKSQSKGG